MLVYVIIKSAGCNNRSPDLYVQCALMLHYEACLDFPQINHSVYFTNKKSCTECVIHSDLVKKVKQW